MKKYGLLLIVLFVSISLFGQAWDTAKPDNRFTFGIRAGANRSALTAALDDDESKWGGHGGLNMDYNIIKSFAIETGIYYSGKGVRINWYWHEVPGHFYVFCDNSHCIYFFSSIRLDEKSLN